MSKRKAIIELHHTGTPIQQIMKRTKVLKSTACAIDGRYRESETANAGSSGRGSQSGRNEKNIDAVLQS